MTPEQLKQAAENIVLYSRQDRYQAATKFLEVVLSELQKVHNDALEEAAIVAEGCQTEWEQWLIDNSGKESLIGQVDFAAMKIRSFKSIEPSEKKAGKE